MTLNLPDYPLPTLSSLGISSLPPSYASSAPQIAQSWLSALSAALASPTLPDLSTLFVKDAFWRDMLALTWDFRTFATLPLISQFLKDTKDEAKPANFRLRQDLLGLQQPYEDVAWVHLMFDFETASGEGFGIARLVPVQEANEVHWKAHVVYTNLEGLKGFPEKIGSLRNDAFNHGRWEEGRRREREFRDSEPRVLILGAGQSGLELAARLKALSIPTLLVERNDRVGDNWRKRYDALCLHDPVWYDHMPYLPFPPTWPVYTPALKLADWLESYAHHLELNVWTSSDAHTITKNPDGSWKVNIKTKEGEEREFGNVGHVVFATGLGSGMPNTPKIQGMDAFKGQILHSSEHKRALDHAGKKVLVVGACTSAHDIAVDYYNHGVDVTMFQRSSTYIMSCKNGWKVLFEGIYSENAPPVEIADRLNASYPHFMSVGLNQRRVADIAAMDKDILDALHARGFRTNLGIKDTGFGLLAWSKAGGYYLDTGASKLIADGKIKLKNDAKIESFTSTGVKFDNGSVMDVDVVVFATGLGDPVEHIRRACGDTIANQCGSIWGLNEEGELNGVWRDLGVKGLWYMMGNLALCRFHSKHVALQIKAIEEGVFGTRYSMKK